MGDRAQAGGATKMTEWQVSWSDFGITLWNDFGMMSWGRVAYSKGGQALPQDFTTVSLLRSWTYWRMT